MIIIALIRCLKKKQKYTFIFVEKVCITKVIPLPLCHQRHKTNFQPLTLASMNTTHTTTAHTTTTTRAAALSLAWAIRKESGLPWGQCQRQAWAVAKLRNTLAVAIAEFSYTKENGETRKASGTLCPDLFTYESKGTGAAAKPTVVRYWDIDAGAFRSFRAERLKVA